MRKQCGRQIAHGQPVKPTILVLSAVYLPGYLGGGPVRSIANLVQHLGNDFTWKIITTDRDIDGKEAYPAIMSEQWTRVGSAEVFYANPAQLGLGRLIHLVRETHYDVLYLNSFFNPAFSIFPMAAWKLGVIPRRPLLIAPRGEFSAGAYALKAFKKKLFVGVARSLGLYSDAAWQASTEYEADDIFRVMGIQKDLIRIAPNLSALPSDTAIALQRVDCNALRVCFLSRIARMKNLDFALRVLRGVGRPVVFTIYGPQEDDRYWAECNALIATLPPHITVKYAGALRNELVCEELSKHDLFFLPTRGENYGHVIVEAWSAGLPVLISDQTPWRDLQEKGIGWDIPLDTPEIFSAAIDEIACWPDEKLTAVRKSCVAFGLQHANNAASIDKNRLMFESLLSVGK